MVDCQTNAMQKSLIYLDQKTPEDLLKNEELGGTRLADDMRTPLMGLSACTLATSIFSYVKSTHATTHTTLNAGIA